jgi:Ca2+-binding RTX toxin-like protein
MNGGVITDTLNQENNNRVSYQNASGAVSVDLAAGTASGAAGNDTLINFSQIRGSGYNDTLFGSDSTLTERFEGLAGNDSIDGRGGFDNVAYDRSTQCGQRQSGHRHGERRLWLHRHAEPHRRHPWVGLQRRSDRRPGGQRHQRQRWSEERFIGNAGNDTIDGGQGYDRVDYTTSPNRSERHAQRHARRQRQRWLRRHRYPAPYRRCFRLGLQRHADGQRQCPLRVLRRPRRQRPDQRERRY